MTRRLPTPGQALEAVLERVRPLDAEQVTLGEALGRVLAEDVTSPDDVPGFDNSAMDGYAVRAQDTRSADRTQPVTLRLVGESRAGSPASRGPGEGEAVRISTGAMLPEGADAVVRVEDTTERSRTVDVHMEVPAGAEIRRAGEDVRAGELVLRRGTVLGPAELGVLASVGVAEPACSRRPTVTLLCTGDELVEPDSPPAPGRVRNSNAYSVAAQIRRAGGTLSRVALVPDNHEATVEALAGALHDDVLVICGGVSVGRHDHVKAALTQLGVEEAFWGVALRPGKPTWFGISTAHAGDERERHTLVFGLPGNPVSAMVTFHLFARPAIAALQGADPRGWRTTARLEQDYPKSRGHTAVVRCRIELREDGWHAWPAKAQGSHVLTSMLGAEALALLDADHGDVAAGQRVEVELLLPAAA